MPHGIAIAVLIEEVIKFNAVDIPVRQASFPQNKYPDSKERYAAISNYLNLGGNTDDEKVGLLIKSITDLKKELNIPLTIKDAGVNEKDFYLTLDDMSEKAFDDQCTSANPRYPMISEIKQIFINSFGEIKPEVKKI